MRRALMLLVTFLVLGVVVIAVIRLRVTGAIVLPQEAATAQDAEPVVWPSIESETTPPAPPPLPPPAANGTQIPTAPPEGWVWWGDLAFRKNAKIQSNYVDNGYSGYEVPVLYMRDGTLVVASKYPNHSACIWSYNTDTGKFSVLHRKTRQAIKRFMDRENISGLTWRESNREYSWERDSPPRRRGKGKEATLRGGAKGDECYDKPSNPVDSQGALLESKTYEEWAILLNGGSLELSTSISAMELSIPFLRAEYQLSARHTMRVRDTATRKLLNSMPSEGGTVFGNLWDFGRGLVLARCIALLSPASSEVPPRIVLLTYPELRVVARVDFPAFEFETIYSVADGLALDVVIKDFGSTMDPGPGKHPPITMPPNLPIPPPPVLPESERVPHVASVLSPGFYRVRVPNDWRTARGQKNTACIWEESSKDLAPLELTQQGEFDVAKYDAYECSRVEGDSTPRNLKSPYVFRDGVVYWRKRHTGEVVMASVDNLDTQTVFGGAGAVWDGFRVNPVRDEVVTWRENGELVFWKVQFPTAEPLHRARVITDETPHRLEAM